MDALSILSALAASLSWGGSDFLGGLSSRRGNVLFVVAVGQLAGLAAAAVLVLVVLRPQWPGLGIVRPVLFCGALEALALVSFYKALALGKMAVVASIGGSSVLLPVAVGLAQGERPSVLQSVAAAIVVVGVMLAVCGPARVAPAEGASEHSKSAPGEANVTPSAVATTLSLGVVESGTDGATRYSLALLAARPWTSRIDWPPERLAIVLAMLAAVLLGLVLLGYNAAARYDPTWAMLGGRAVTAACVCPFLLVRRRVVHCRAVTPGAALAGLLTTVGWGFFAYASTRGYLSITAVLATTYPAVPIALALVLLHERLARRQLVGVGTTLAGIVLVAAG